MTALTDGLFFSLAEALVTRLVKDSGISAS